MDPCRRTTRNTTSPRLGAALSLGPLLLIVTSVAGLFFGAEAVRGSLTAQFRSLLGETGGKAVEAMLAGASSLQSGRQAAVLGSLLLLADGQRPPPEQTKLYQRASVLTQGRVSLRQA